MRDKENLTELMELGVDFVGFIFYEKSKRFVDELMDIDYPKPVKKVGVFVNETEEVILEKINDNCLDVIQLHGDESPDFCNRIKESLLKNTKAVSIVKAFAVDAEFNFEQTDLFTDSCDFFLFDTKGIYYGGNSIQFDWSLLRNYKGVIPYFLSGGIGPETLNELESFLETPESSKCFAIDLNSKFEDAPGLKNIEKLRKFKEALK